MNKGERIKLELLDGTIAEGTIYNNLHYDVILIYHNNVKKIITNLY